MTTRDRVIDNMHEVAKKMVRRGWTKEAERKIFGMAIDYNGEHYGEDEIFVAELDEGIAIEDDVYHFERF